MATSKAFANFVSYLKLWYVHSSPLQNWIKFNKFEVLLLNSESERPRPMGQTLFPFAMAKMSKEIFENYVVTHCNELLVIKYCWKVPELVIEDLEDHEDK